MPGISPAGFTVSLTFAGAFPLAGLSVSQLFWLGPAAMVNACAEPPAAANARVPGVRRRSSAGGAQRQPVILGGSRGYGERLRGAVRSRNGQGAGGGSGRVGQYE